jgi:acetyl esterase/lipase
MKTLVGKLASGKTGPAPLIECYPSARPLPSRPAVLIFPGGGYGGLADYEGAGYAWYLAGHGISSFVVSYRLGTQGFHHPAMLEDALSAVAAVREAAEELGIAGDRIGVMGSSAGGHLAAHAMVAHEAYRAPVSLRPDFGVLCYPVISMAGDLAEPGSRANLLGPEPSRALMEEVSCDLHVSNATPPCFLWHTRDDTVVSFQNSMAFAARLQVNRVPFEMHIFDRGPHGLGQDLSHPWAGLCARWIRDLPQAGPAARADSHPGAPGASGSR